MVIAAVLAAAHLRHPALAPSGSRSLPGLRADAGRAEIRLRRWVMIEAHLLILLPLCAVMMARGIGMK
ncbi:DUF2214 family protein [Cupriavidus basilensis]